MFKVKDIVKKIQDYTTNLQRSGFVYERNELIKAEEEMIIGRTMCEDCIN